MSGAAVPKSIGTEQVIEREVAWAAFALLIPFFGTILLAIWQGVLVNNVGVHPIESAGDWLIAAGLGVIVIAAIALIDRAHLPLLQHEPMADLAAKLGVTSLCCIVAFLAFPHTIGIVLQPTVKFLTQLASMTAFYAFQYAFAREGYRMLKR